MKSLVLIALMFIPGLPVWSETEPSPSLQIAKAARAKGVSLSPYIADILGRAGVDVRLMNPGILRRGCDIVLAKIGQPTSQEKLVKQLDQLEPGLQAAIKQNVVQGVPAEEAINNLFGLYYSIELAKSEGSALKIYDLPAPFSRSSGNTKIPDGDSFVFFASLVESVNEHYLTGKISSSPHLVVPRVVAVKSVTTKRGLRHFLDFDVTFVGSNRQTFRMKLEKFALSNKNPADFVYRLIHLGKGAVEMAASPEGILHEMNALKYSLKVLTRTAAPDLQIDLVGLVRQMNSLVTRLQKTGTVEEKTLAILDFATIKERLLVLAQNEMKAAVKKGTARNHHVEAMKIANPQRGFVTAGMKGKTEVYIARKADTDSSFAADIVFAMDPLFMITHPWFIGAKDGSLISYLMMMQLLSHRSNSYDFSSRTFDKDFFPEPGVFSRSDLEPLFYRDSENAVVHPWTERPNSDESVREIMPHVSSQGIQWVNVNNARSEKWNAFDNSGLERQVWTTENESTSGEAIDVNGKVERISDDTPVDRWGSEGIRDLPVDTLFDSSDLNIRSEPAASFDTRQDS